jgi:hypothetical protein
MAIEGGDEGNATGLQFVDEEIGYRHLTVISATRDGGKEVHFAVFADPLQQAQLTGHGINCDRDAADKAVVFGIVEFVFESGEVIIERVDDLAHGRSWDLDLLAALGERL